jgi:methylmalonyl-CoA mutase
MSTKNLFAEFSPVTRQQWVEKAIQDLKGADFDKKLVWNTYEGFSIQPFYTAEDVEPLKAFTEFVRSVQKTSSAWINYVEIPSGTPAQQQAEAIHGIQQGAAGLLFTVDDPAAFRFDEVLTSIDPASVHISFSLGSPSAPFIQNYFSYLKSRNIDLASVRGFCEADILENHITGKSGLTEFSALAKHVQAAAQAPAFSGLVIRSQSFADAGGNITQELAFTLNKFVQYISALTGEGLVAEQVIRQAYLQTAITGDYFPEIAKIRALRALVARIIHQYGVEPQLVPVLSTSSLWTKSRYDAYTNMLRNTTEAMSALAGGCDALLIRPHVPGHPDSFSTRMALNVSNILKAESYFDQVADAAAGSYYVEVLTHQLYEHALGLFKEIEQAGGFIRAFEQDIIQQKIKTVRERKLLDVATRKQVYIGVNQYADLAEKLSGHDQVTEQNPRFLIPQRATRAFELLRSETEHISAQRGKPVRVYLLAFGNLAMRKARVAFSQNFFAAAGFLTEEHFHENSLDGISDGIRSEADILVLCASDDDYATHAESLTREFTKQETNKILVLAGYPPALVDTLRAAGLPHFIHLKSNAIEVLTTLQQQISQAQR